MNATEARRPRPLRVRRDRQGHISLYQGGELLVADLDEPEQRLLLDDLLATTGTTDRLWYLLDACADALNWRGSGDHLGDYEAAAYFEGIAAAAAEVLDVTARDIRLKAILRAQSRQPRDDDSAA